MRSINRQKRGQLSTLTPSMITLVIAVIVLVMGIVVIQEIRDVDIHITNVNGCNDTDTSLCGTAYRATNDSLVGLADFADFIPIIVIAVAASIIIGLILVGFAFSGKGR